MCRIATVSWWVVLLAPMLAQSQSTSYYQRYRQPYAQLPERLVQSWYQRYLGREPEPTGLVGTMEALRRGQSPEGVVASILGGVEFYSRAGLTPEGYIRNLYQVLAGRPPAPQEVGYWLQQMNVASRTDVAYALLARFPQSWVTEPLHPDVPRYDYRLPIGRQAFAAEQPERLVQLWYQRYLGREPEPTGLVGTMEALRRGQSPEAVVASILGGVEFYSRAGLTPEGYIRNLFQVLAVRPPTPQEVGYWLQQMNFASRTDVAYALLARFPQSWVTEPIHPDVSRYDYRLPTWPNRW